MIETVKYSENYKKTWDDFIDNSKNGLFMFKRDYMEYHSERFQDYSLMFYDANKLIAVMPASISNNIVVSHGGLTFGGIISPKKMTAALMLEIFDVLKAFLHQNKIHKLIYKCIPLCYHLYPAEEDLYALFRNNAVLVRRDISSTILLENKIIFSELRKRCVKKAIKNGLVCRESNNFHAYVELLTKVLEENHGVKPVHTVEELLYLSSLFPDSIKLFCAFDEKNVMHAGVIIFESQQTIHTQYIANSSEGRNMGALDLVMDYLINTYAAEKQKKYFDFGISTEKQGTFLNEGLINQKEMFGGRGIVHDFYELEIV